MDPLPVRASQPCTLPNVNAVTSDVSLTKVNVMTSVGSEGVRRLLAKHEPMLGLHGHIHESRGAVRLGHTLAERLRPKVTGAPPELGGERFLEALLHTKTQRSVI